MKRGIVMHNLYIQTITNHSQREDILVNDLLGETEERRK